MRALIIGYGSMGKRRIRILKRLVPDISFICVDTNQERLKQIEADGYSGKANLNEALGMKPDFAFVCTSPGHHGGIMLDIVKAGIDVFTELNLIADHYEEIMRLSEEKKAKIFMSSTMLYDKQIIAIQNEIKKYNEPKTYLYHVGQYLPSWHPWESYKDFFIGQKQTNGCREILAIQMPWLIRSFGRIKNISCVTQKNTKLEIDYDDTYLITIEHENGCSGVFVCDVLSRNAVNYLEIMGESIHIMWNGTPETLSRYDIDEKKMVKMISYESIEHIKGYADLISEEPYYDEVRAFLDYIKNDQEPIYTLNDDKYIIGIIDKIERL